jgi:CheY-like chemotaxis protein
MPKKILIVEDEADWQVRIREAIEGMGYDVALASTEVEAHSKFNAKPSDFSLILLDPNLTPSGDDRKGLLFLSQLRKQGIGVPCVVLTSYLSREMAKDLLASRDY